MTGAMTVEELDRVLSELRQVRDDHQTVEVKRSRTRLPATTWETLSAFANTIGGTLLFGVDEASGQFDVTGVEDAGATTNAIRDLCAELDPPIRPIISTVLHPAGAVVVAVVPPLAHDKRPCYRRRSGASAAYIRVGDGDHKLTQVEVDEMLAARSGEDFSRRPAQTGVKLDPAAVTSYLAAFRNRSPREADVPDDILLVRNGVVVTGDVPTIAGALVLGAQPQNFEAAADVAFRREPEADAPPTARMRGRHYKGTVGELLDDVMAAIVAELRTYQVERSGTLVDETDVPREAIREVLSNALMHRSFTPALSTVQVAVTVSDDAVEVISPGGIHVGTGLSTLGLEGIAGLRNLTLANIAELTRTPSGSRIIEHQASGIAAADRTCHRNGSMPPLFVDHPMKFQVVMLRGSIDTTRATADLNAKGVKPTPAMVRLLAAAHRLAELSGETRGHAVGHTPLDARLAARVLSPCHVEDAATVLRQLEDAGMLERHTVRRDPTWVPVRPTAATRKPEPRQADRVLEVVAAIAKSVNGELRPKEIGAQLGLTSPDTRNKWIQRAVSRELIEPTKESAYDPSQTYRLTPTGQAQVEAQDKRTHSR